MNNTPGKLAYNESVKLSELIWYLERGDNDPDHVGHLLMDVQEQMTKIARHLTTLAQKSDALIIDDLTKIAQMRLASTFDENGQMVHDTYNG